MQGLTIFLLICSAFLLIPVQAGADSTSNNIKLFSSFIEKEQTELADQHMAADSSITSTAATASRIAQVAINADAIDVAKIAPGAVVGINLFDNKSLEAEIDKVGVSNKITTIRGKINNSANGYIITTVDENRVLTVIELPAEGYQYKIIYDNDLKTHFLYKTPLSALDILENAPSLIAPPRDNDSRSLYDAPTEIAEPFANTTIDVMVVYTPAAASWAAANGGIVSIIDQAMERSRLALVNSNTSITMNLVHSAQVSYTEAGYNNDLNRLTNTSDGYMDNVHTLRDQYGADLVALFSYETVTGGVGWLLQHKRGRPELGFCIVRAQQAHYSYTHIHEMGHNMGAHHHKDQVTPGNPSVPYQPGPTRWYDWSANTWSAGWRWVGNDSNKYCSLMTYGSGSYFPDGQTHYRTANFSNPDVYHQGQAIGHATSGDNARTLREIRTVIAAYRTPAEPECTSDGGCDGDDVCSGSNTCVECEIDSDCIIAGTCDGNLCIPYECTSNGQCTGDEDICDVGNSHECVECLDNNNCDGGTCESNLCIPYECTSNGQCTGDDVCDVGNSYECVECLVAGDCDGGDLCSSNACVECIDDGDCDGDDVCSGNTCVECANDGNCADGTCESNICIPYECTVDGDCTDEEVCFNHKCVACEIDTDCDDGDFCNGEEQCNSNICSSGADPCAAGELCDEDADQCIEPAECEEDADCSIGVCLDDTCVECKADDDCSGEVCSEYNTCVECTNDDDCSDGACSYENVCVECADDDDCPDGTCLNNVCGDCTENDDCISNICLRNKCLECITWVECDNGDVCLDNVCVECADDDDCRDGVCLDTICSECVIDADCDRGTCIDNICGVAGSVQIDKFTVKVGKNGKGDSLKFSGLMDADVADFNAAWLSDVIVTVEADTIPDMSATTFTFPIKNDYLKNFKYKPPKVKPLNKTDPVMSLQIDTIKGIIKFSGKNLDLSGLSCPITLSIQIGGYAAEIVLGENIVNGTKKPCPPELMSAM